LASRLGYPNELDVPEGDSKMVETKEGSEHLDLVKA
jgi:hypothetical protein